MPKSTYKTFLMKKESDEWKKVVNIKNFPDLGGEPEMLETTTLSDEMQTYIPGIQSQEALSFTANYDKEEFAKVKALEGEEYEYAVWFGGTGSGKNLVPTGSDGKFKFSGQLSVYVTGGDVNTVREMNISIAPSTPVEFEEE